MVEIEPDKDSPEQCIFNVIKNPKFKMSTKSKKSQKGLAMGNRQSNAIALTAILATAIYANSISAYAQPGKNNCTTKTYEIGERVSRIGAQMINIGSIANGQGSMYRNPANPWSGQRDGVFILELGNRATVYSQKEAYASESIMSSPVLQMNWAREIIKSCDKVSKVTYRLTGSDWITNYYLMHSGDIRHAQCLSPANRGDASLPWGFEVCI